MKHRYPCAKFPNLNAEAPGVQPVELPKEDT